VLRLRCGLSGAGSADRLLGGLRHQRAGSGLVLLPAGRQRPSALVALRRGLAHSCRLPSLANRAFLAGPRAGAAVASFHHVSFSGVGFCHVLDARLRRLRAEPARPRPPGPASLLPSLWQLRGDLPPAGTTVAARPPAALALAARRGAGRADWPGLPRSGLLANQALALRRLPRKNGPPHGPCGARSPRLGGLISRR